jgi:heme/copper-type cytochrome/quinol oxidase subunit 2
VTDQLLGVVVFVGYGIVVLVALVLAVVVFRTGDDAGDRRSPDDGVGQRSASWWRRWR